jgi:uroporphyrinogen-III decarboxylase
MLHSCGYQMPFLEHYVEAELDLLQSFQPKAGNDFAAAYAQYGDRLAFATGIDTQRGETMTPQELRREILDNYAIGKTKGRHILGTTHMIQYAMPLENLRALFGTVQEIQAGLHG